jgi:hypothetical protein
MSNIIWQSTVTSEMVGDMTEDEIRILIDELNDAVADVCEANKLKG